MLIGNMTATSARVPDACGERPAAQRGVKTNIWSAPASCRRSSNTRLPRCCRNPMVAHPQPGATEEPVEEAELLENLGEFPGRSDQGDRVPAPMTKQKARAFLRRG
jgi:hypothetical protein